MPPVNNQLVNRRVKRSFVPEGEGEPRRKGTVIVGLTQSKAEEYDARGYTEEPDGPPSAEASARSMAGDAEQKEAALKAKENKEATGKDASGLEPWTLATTPAAYVEKYGGDASASDEVKERVKLARAHVKAEANQ